MKFLLSAITLFLSISLSAQGPPPLVDSGSVIAKGIIEHDKEAYEEAIEYYDMVHENDTNYIWSLYEKAYSLTAMEKYEEAIPILEDGVALESTLYFDFLTMLHSVYYDLDRFDEGIAMFDKAIEQFPYNYTLYYNRAVSKEKKGSILGAFEDYKETIRLNPFHSLSHYRLATICAHEGLLTQAMLSYNTFLLLEPGTKRALSVLIEFDEFASGKFDAKPSGVDVRSFEEEAFENLDAIIKSKVALNKKLEIPTKVDYACIRQNYAIFQKLKYDENSENWWMKTYVPFYKQIMEKDYFVDFTHYILLSSPNEAISKLVKKNLKGVKTFSNWAFPEWRSMRDQSEIMFDGKKQKVKHHYDDDGRLQALGELLPNGYSEGYWEFFYQNGRMAAVGNFDNDKRVGDWIYYYNNGNVKESVSFKDDNREGEMTLFYDNGQMKEKGMVKAGNAEGKFVYFSKYGTRNGIAEYDNGDQVGLAQYFFLDETPKYELNFKDNEIDGVFKEYYPQGMLYAETTFKMGEKNGVRKKYHKNGELAGEEIFVDDIAEGPWKEYYDNGQMSAEGTMKKGKLFGKRTGYFSNGTVADVAEYNENGEQSGTFKTYDYDGLLSYEFDYKNGEIRAYRYYDKTGKIIKEATKKSGALAFEGFWPDGTKKLKGSYSLGSNARDGDWTYFNKYGVVKTKSKHDNGAQNGLTKEYHDNGALHYEINYKDDEQNGYYKSYYINGSSGFEGWVVDDKQEGEWISYYKDGKTINKKLWYLNGELDGRQYYYAPNGKLDDVSVYDNGQFIVEEIYDTTGTLIQTLEITGETKDYTFLGASGNKSRTTRMAGLEHNGQFTWYFSDGSISSEANYVNGEIHGLLKEYYVNGQLSKEGTYVYGNRDGVWKEYFMDGTIKRMFNYDNGNAEGEWKWYHYNGTLETVKQFKNDLPFGEGYYYDPNGVLRLVRYYDGNNGKMIGYASPDATGKKADEKVAINENEAETIVQGFFPNGNPSFDYKIEHGYSTGVFLNYYENGQLHERISYKKGYEDGIREEYFENGQLRFQTTISLGERHGSFTRYYENGQIAEESQFFYGMHHGPSKFYDKSGQLTASYNWYAGEIMD